MNPKNVFHRSFAFYSMRINQYTPHKSQNKFSILYKSQKFQYQTTFVSTSFYRFYPMKFRFDHNQNGNNQFALKRFYSGDIQKKYENRFSKKKELITEKFQMKRTQFKERKDVLIQELRDKKIKVKERVEEIVERENIMTIPNLLSVGRSILAPYVGYVIVQEQYELAIGLVAIAGITDLLDGFIARTWTSQASKLGSFLDPMADKLLVGSLVISLSYCTLFPIWLSAMVILRDVFLIIAGFIIRFISLPPPRTLSRYFDATHVTAKLEPTFTSKVNTAIQLITIGASLGAPIYGYIDHSLLQTSWYFTGLTTILAALSYVLSKNTYKIIRKHKTF